MMKMERRAPFVAVAVLAGIIWFALLGYRDLFDPDEGRYADIPAAMVTTGDWLTPRLNGIKYFEKPALQYWASATVFSLAGKGNASARLVPALAGYLGALFAAFLAFRLFGSRAASFAFLFAVSSLMWVAMGHILTLDMLLSVFLFIGMGCLAIAQSDRTDRIALRFWMLAGWVALSMAVLTKGLIGLALPVMSVVVYSAWQRDWQIWKHLQLLAGLLLFLALVSPWFVAVNAKNPEFAEFFFIHEHWDRYTTASHHREGPIYYFIPFLLAGLLPWLMVSLGALLKPAFKWFPDAPGTFDAARLLWSFVLVTFLFFSLGHSKLPAYILPLMPAVSVLAAQRMAGAKKLHYDGWLMVLIGAAVVVLALNGDFLADDRYTPQLLQDFRPWVLATGSLLMLAGAAMQILKKAPLLACGIAAMISLLAFQLMLWGAQTFASVRSSRNEAEAILNSIPPASPVFSVGTFPESAVFYLGKPITVSQYTGEFEFGFEQEPHLRFSSLNRLLEEWYRLDSAAMIVNRDQIETFFPGLDLGKIVYLGPKRAVIVRKGHAAP